jgi:hypothetical protein
MLLATSQHRLLQLVAIFQADQGKRLAGSGHGSRRLLDAPTMPDSPDVVAEWPAGWQPHHDDVFDPSHDLSWRDSQGGDNG